MRITGLVVGTRKAATTWIYKNLLESPAFCVSRKVKESGFFAGTSGIEFTEYCGLFQPEVNAYCIEVDSSICYSDDCIERIDNYAPNANVVLILRNPIDYLVSRYIHSKRKGELVAETLAGAVSESEWLRGELDYQAIVSRMRGLGDGRLLVLQYELIRSNKLLFWKKIVFHLSGREVVAHSVPVGASQNVARESKLPFVSKWLALCAKWARRYQLHIFVNAVKRVGVHRFLEKEVEQGAHLDLRKQAEKLVKQDFKESIKVWESINLQ